MNVARFFPFLDLRTYRFRDIPADLFAALTVTFLAVPQGIAYALIAGLPPVMGLYATTIPVVLGSLFRSSRHVVTGPSNAVSLLVGGGIAALSGQEPVKLAIALALLVGVFQILAGVLRLGAVVDYLSAPVVLGYITGAGLLIGIGQLPQVTGSPGASGRVWTQLFAWVEGLGQLQWLSVAMAAGTAIVCLGVRRLNRRWPSALIAMVVATLLAYLLELRGAGLQTIADVTPVPRGFPALTLPDLSLLFSLVPLAIACTVLSLVEATTVGRTIASRTGQSLDASAEFTGQGLANVAASFCGAYPISGSLSRSALNASSGAMSRMAGVYSGLLMLIVLLLLGPMVNETPIASLAGLLVIIAFDLVDIPQIKRTFRSRLSDRVAFAVTLIGTWALPLDQAIYVGVGLSLILFLREARLLFSREMAVTRHLQLQEIDKRMDSDSFTTCPSIKILNVEGPFFFGAEGELYAMVEDAVASPECRVLILRLTRTQGMDMTIALSLEAAAQRLREQGRALLLVGLREDAMEELRAVGALDAIGEGCVFPREHMWYGAMSAAVEKAQELAGTHHDCETCPLSRFLADRALSASDP